MWEREQKETYFCTAEPFNWSLVVNKV